MKWGKNIGFFGENTPFLVFPVHLLWSLSKATLPTPIFLPLWAFLNPWSHNTMMFCCLTCKDGICDGGCGWKDCPSNPFHTGKLPRIVHPCCIIGPSCLATIYFLYFHRRNYLAKMPSWSDSNIFCNLFKLFYIFWNFQMCFWKLW